VHGKAYFNVRSYMGVPCAIIEYEIVLGSLGSKKLLGAIA
jgi:hypothetical protein